MSMSVSADIDCGTVFFGKGRFQSTPQCGDRGGRYRCHLRRQVERCSLALSGAARRLFNLLRTSGLRKPTLFQFDVITSLYYNSDWFLPPEVPPHPVKLKDPQIGFFPPAQVEALEFVLYGKDGHCTEVQEQVEKLMGKSPP